MNKVIAVLFVISAVVSANSFADDKNCPVVAAGKYVLGKAGDAVKAGFSIPQYCEISYKQTDSHLLVIGGGAGSGTIDCWNIFNEKTSSKSLKSLTLNVGLGLGNFEREGKIYMLGVNDANKVSDLLLAHAKITIADGDGAAIGAAVGVGVGEGNQSNKYVPVGATAVAGLITESVKGHGAAATVGVTFYFDDTVQPGERPAQESVQSP